MLAARRLATAARTATTTSRVATQTQRRRFFLFGGGNNAPKGFGHFYPKGAISASRRVEAPSLPQYDSCPGEDALAGFFFEFEAVRTESSDRDAPRRQNDDKRHR